MEISGRIAVVTGGARGIGKCYVEFLLKNGAKVCIADVLEEKAKSTVAELTTRFGNKICCAKCDVTKLDEIKAVLPIAEQRFGGKVSIWVNNAGVSIRDRDQRNTIIAVNVKGVMDGTYAAFDYMDKDCGGEGGNIVNITSVAGLVAAGGNSVYFTSKHAVTAFTQSFAHEITEKHPTSGVILSGLAPTFVRTDMTSNFSINSWDSEGTVYKMFHEYKGWEKAEDVAAGLISLLEREDSHNVILLVKGKVMKRIKTTIEELDW